MRVLYSDGCFSAQRQGGISRYFVELFRSLETLAVDFSCFAGRHANAHLLDACVQKTFASRITHKPLNRTVRLPERFLNEMRFQRIMHASQPSLVHHTYYPLLFEANCIPGIITVHDMIDEIFPSRSSGAILKRMIRQRAASLATRIVAVSQATKADITRFWDVDGDKIDVIHHGTSPLPTPQDPPLNRPYFLFVGRRDGYKAFLFTMSAFALTKSSAEIDFVCFGGGPLTPVETEFVSRHGLSDRVHHRLGDDRMLASSYRHAIALLYTSRYEGFGLPILEAMSMGCPVLAFSGSSIPEIAGDAAFLVEPSDAPDVLAKAIDRLAGDTQLRRELGESGLGRARQFSWTKCAKMHVDVYRRALAQHAG